MTASLSTFSFTEPLFPLNILFADDSERDLDFDEGLEDDELHQSKPPSRRPLLWILLVVLAVAIAYWTLQSPSTGPKSRSEATIEAINSSQDRDNTPYLPSPKFREEQKVSLSDGMGESLLMGDPSSSKPGPIIKAGEVMTILDGSYELKGWMYQVKTPSGKIGWVSGEKLKLHSS